jgi:hypothetical protein
LVAAIDNLRRFAIAHGAVSSNGEKNILARLNGKATAATAEMGGAWARHPPLARSGYPHHNQK